MTANNLEYVHHLSLILFFCLVVSLFAMFQFLVGWGQTMHTAHGRTQTFLLSKCGWIGDIFFTQKLTIFFKSPKFSPKLVTKNPKIGRNYCHQNWWHFRHSKTHQFLQFTKNVTKIGEKFGENSIENSNHQNFRQNWWKFWRKFNRKSMWAPTSPKLPFQVGPILDFF